ncbi:MAG: hypothetical protein Q8K65_02705 [Alphaproteobacteria bacterium]|nr:hypothetical protein [Alphaproteobacteria bacterium]
MGGRGLRLRISVCLGLALVLNVAFWFGAHETSAHWGGVPPVPTKNGARIMTLGDEQFSYRFGAITLQNLGSSGGRITAIKDYDYQKLGQWFWLLHGLDPASNHVPMMAAYYFGATQKPEDIAVVVEYLGTIGQNPAGNKWRWLAHAIFLARHRMDNLPLALDMAYVLSRMQPIGDVLPAWARQMPAFVLAEQGEKQTARRLIEEILMTATGLHPNEVSYMRDYLIEELDVPAVEVQQIINMRGQDLMRSSSESRVTLPAPLP